MPVDLRRVLRSAAPLGELGVLLDGERLAGERVVHSLEVLEHAFVVVRADRIPLERVAETAILFGFSETDSTQIEKVSLFYR